MNVAVVGMGLIGGSFYKAAVRAGHTVRGIGHYDPVDVSDADLVLLAIPPTAVVPWIRAQAAAFKTGALVVDATGVKTEICRALHDVACQDRWTFVGGHPMAGKEVGGFANSTADLFAGASMILTPFPSCGRHTIETLEAFFKELGFARVVLTTPEHHDRMIALTSQLAHLVSSAYVRDPRACEHAGYSAGSFHDMTRVAGVDPAMWTDLFLANRTALLETLDGFIARLGEYRAALAAADASAIRAALAAGRAAHAAMQNSAAE